MLAAIVLFAFGASLGSFINVVALRFVTDTPLTGRSRCRGCQRPLRWWELIPIASFFLVRGRCVRCRSSLSIQYPLVELAFGLAALLVLSPLPPTPLEWVHRVALLAVIGWLAVLFLIDWHTMLLPDRYLVGLTLVAMIVLVTHPRPAPLIALSGALIGAGFLFIVWLVTRGRGIGLGDVKLLIPVGALLGIKGTLLMLWLAFWAGGLIGLYLLIARRATLKTAIPFGPFLVAATIIVLLNPRLADRIFEWVLG